MKNIKKGFLLNFAYEGSHIILKLILFCLVFYVVQLLIGYNIIKTQDNFISYEQSFGYLSYSEVFNSSIMPYVFTAFMVASFGGIYYIFKKDTMGSNKLNAIYTLPFPRYCNFLAKFFYCTLFPISVYAVQILANLTIMNFHVGAVSFRDNELFLSSQFDGVYQFLFAPKLPMLWVLLILIYFVSSFMHDFTSRAVGTNLKVGFLFSLVQYTLIWCSYSFILSKVTLRSSLGISVVLVTCLLCTFINLFLAYRKVKV